MSKIKGALQYVTKIVWFALLLKFFYVKICQAHMSTTHCFRVLLTGPPARELRRVAP